MLRRTAGFLICLLMPAMLGVASPGNALAAPVRPDIVNGYPPSDASTGFLAHIRAYVGPDQFYSCGGSFVSPTQVVTAAHCVHDEDSRRLGRIKVGVPSGTAVPTMFVNVARVEAHEDFSMRREDHDIALLTLADAIPGVAVATVPSVAGWRSVASPGSAVISAGWGSTESGGDGVDDFLLADLEIVPDDVCGDAKATYRIGGLEFIGIGSEFDPSTMVCAGGATPWGAPVDTCQGDSGGPLAAATTSGPVLVGIVSWGYGCAGSDDGDAIPLTPGVYTRLVAYLPWLGSRGVGPTVARPAGQVGGLRVTDVERKGREFRAKARWATPAKAGGWKISGYRMRYGTAGDWTAWRSASRTEKRLMGLEPGTTYRVQVRAVTAAGWGARTGISFRTP